MLQLLKKNKQTKHLRSPNKPNVSQLEHKEAIHLCDLHVHMRQKTAPKCRLQRDLFYLASQQTVDLKHP